MHATAVVMNMFYTGIGIARSLGERGIPVLGLTSQRGIYGNFTRYAKVVRCPDSRKEPDALLRFLQELAATSHTRSVIFPTRDDDVLFLDRHRDELAAGYSITIPGREALRACLDKWQTHLAARQAGVAAPNAWLIENRRDLDRILPDLKYPCVLKPVEAYQWRQGANWAAVGGRKAIGVSSEAELLGEYGQIEGSQPRALIEEMVPGGDDSLLIAACYFDRASNCVASFNTRKLLQVPAAFGTGCVVQATDRPELLSPTVRLLKHIGYTGVAEVEYKCDSATGEFKLIEVNPRPWDQHRLGSDCGTDLVYLAYCEHSGLGIPAVHKRPSAQKWIAEDTFIMALVRSVWRRDGEYRSLVKLATGKRLYAIWSMRDPLPFLVYMVARFLPALLGDTVKVLWSAVTTRTKLRKEALLYENRLDKGKDLG